MLTALLVIAILVLLIIAHEFGHFIVAKLSGVRVEEFGIGYPPRAFTLGRWGGTEYTINWIPFGGFVRLWGDEAEGERGPGSLAGAPRLKQGAILVAGVAMNVLAAWFLFAVALHAGVPRLVEDPLPGEETRLIVAGVVPASPADVAGLGPGDEILALAEAGEEGGAGRAAEGPLTPERVIEFVRERGGERLAVTYLRDGATSTAAMIPANAVLPEAAGRPALGVSLALVATRALPWSEAFVQAVPQTGTALRSVGSDLWRLAKTFADGSPDLEGVVGPVGIVSYVGSASQTGWGSVLMLAALVSANLAIINLLPLPALDGGRLLILGIEAFARRRAPRLAVQALNTLGIAAIVLLMIVITYHDIARLLA